MSPRTWVPLLAAVLLLVAAGYVPPLLTYLLVIVAFGLFFDVGTAWLSRAGGTGGLKDFRQ